MNRSGPFGGRAGRTAVTSVLLLAGVVACSSSRDDPGLLGADDQRQLNAAAALLDSNSIDPSAFGNHESSAHD